MSVRVAIEETSEVERKLNIEIPQKIYRSEFDRAVSTTTNQARIKGFRPGRAPRAMVVKAYGEQIKGDVLRKLVSEAYTDAVKEHELKVVGNPDIEIKQFEDDKDVVVIAGIALLPEPKITGHDKLSFDVEIEQFDEADIDHQLKHVREAFGKIEPIEKTVAEKGDVAMIEYTLAGEEAEGESKGRRAHVEIGSAHFPKEFEDQLIGMKIGTEKDVTLETPKAEGDEEAAEPKSQTYHVKLESLFTKVLPELTDQFVRENKLGENLADYRIRVKEDILAEIERRNTQAKEAKALQTLAEKNDFKVPQVMIDDEIRRIFFENRVLDPSKRESYDMDVSYFREKFGKQAEDRVRSNIILAQLIAQEKIEANDADLDAWFDGEASRGKTTKEAVKKAVRFPEQRPAIERMVKRQKLLTSVLESAAMKEKTKDKNYCC